MGNLGCFFLYYLGVETCYLGFRFYADILDGSQKCCNFLCINCALNLSCKLLNLVLPISDAHRLSTRKVQLEILHDCFDFVSIRKVLG